MRKLLDIQRGDWPAIVLHVRRATGLGTGALAGRAGVRSETWWRWEKGKQRPEKPDVIERFAKGFGLEMDDVMWAAGLLVEDEPTTVVDPRLRGLDPNDPVVVHIMSLNVDEEMRGYMLDRRRQIIADRVRADIEDQKRMAEMIERVKRDRGQAA